MKSTKKYFIIGFIIVSALGTLFHFVYNWSNGNVIVGLFTPINESVWEHIKLLFFPMLFYTLFGCLKYRSVPCINSGMAIGIFVGALLIPVLFYTYTGIIGTHYAFIDISIFYISTAAAFYTAYKATANKILCKYKTLLNILLAVMVIAFIIFTFSPPNLPLFKNP